MCRLLIAVRGVVDQRGLRSLESLCLTAACLQDRALGRVEILIAGLAADLRCFARGQICLLLLVGLLRRHLPALLGLRIGGWNADRGGMRRTGVVGGGV